MTYPMTNQDNSRVPEKVRQFVDFYLEDDTDVKTFQWIQRIELISFVLTGLGVLMVIFQLVSDPIYDALGTILELSDPNPEGFIWLGFPLFLISSPIFYFSRKRVSSNDLSRTAVTYHYIAKSLQSVIENEYQEGFNSLTKVNRRIERSSIKQLHPVREFQIKELYEKLDSLDTDQRIDEIEEHYFEFFNPICDELNNFRNDPDLMEIIDEIGGSQSQPHPLRQALTEIFGQIFEQPIRNYLPILVIFLLTVGVGISSGVGWAALVPSLYLLYRQRSKSSDDD